jgi:FKBP-type peptidyl-prolyl cis-trans isomerase 2/predicted heme/steroid binding protein
MSNCRIEVLHRHLTVNASKDISKSSSNMNDENFRRTVRGGDIIKVHIKGHAKSNISIDAGMFEKDTTTFKVGPDTKGPLQPALSKAVLGLHIGEGKEFEILPTDSEHPQAKRDKSLVITVPTGGAKVIVGTTVRLQHEGSFRLATVVSKDEEKEQATIDMNDPLAGRVLVYRVTVEEMDAFIDLTKQLFSEPPSVPNKKFTLKDLSKYNGQNNTSIYLGVNGYVFDMSSGSKFYGPGGTYGFMAGHDATVALAKFSMNPMLLNKPWTLNEMEESELHTLANYVRTFTNKYPIVGRLVI